MSHTNLNINFGRYIGGVGFRQYSAGVDHHLQGGRGGGVMRCWEGTEGKSGIACGVNLINVKQNKIDDDDPPTIKSEKKNRLFFPFSLDTFTSLLRLESHLLCQ